MNYLSPHFFIIFVNTNSTNKLLSVMAFQSLGSSRLVQLLRFGPKRGKNERKVRIGLKTPTFDFTASQMSSTHESTSLLVSLQREIWLICMSLSAAVFRGSERRASPMISSPNFKTQRNSVSRIYNTLHADQETTSF